MTLKNDFYISRIIGSALFVTITLIIYNFICRSYYQGTPGFDGPLLSYLMYHNTYEPNFVHGHGITGPYYQTHLSIIFALLSSLSYVLPFNRIEYFGFIQGMFVALSGLVAYLFLYKHYAPVKNLRWIIICSLMALFFALNGITLRVIYYHHFEAWIPILVIMFLYYWCEQKHLYAYISFVLLLLVREDAGFHFFGLIFLTSIYSYFKHKKFDKKLTSLAIVAFTYSLLAFWAQKHFYPGDAAFARVYLDFSQSNPFEHLTTKEVLLRFKLIFIKCAYLSVPIVLQTYCACSKKQRVYSHILIGLLSCVPWIMLSLVSKAPHTILTTYSSFPLIIIFFWPFFSYVYFESQSTLKRIRLSVLKWQGAIIIISVLLSGNVLFKICKINTTVNAENVKLFQQELIDNKHKLGKLYATVGILGLDPSIANYPNVGLDTVIYNAGGRSKCDDVCTDPKLNHFYKIDETNIRIATTYDLKQLKLFSNLEAENSRSTS